MEADIKLKDALQEGQDVNDVIQEARVNDEKAPWVEPKVNNGLMVPLGKVRALEFPNSMLRYL